MCDQGIGRGSTDVVALKGSEQAELDRALRRDPLEPGESDGDFILATAERCQTNPEPAILLDRPIEISSGDLAGQVRALDDVGGPDRNQLKPGRHTKLHLEKADLPGTH